MSASLSARPGAAVTLAPLHGLLRLCGFFWHGQGLPFCGPCALFASASSWHRLLVWAGLGGMRPVHCILLTRTSVFCLLLLAAVSDLVRLSCFGVDGAQCAPGRSRSWRQSFIGFTQLGRSPLRSRGGVPSRLCVTIALSIYLSLFLILPVCVFY
jgi:hypothetical protein